MNWKRMLAYVTGSVDEELLARNEYLATENRILRNQIRGRIRLTDPERISLAKVAKRLGRKALGEIAQIVRPGARAWQYDELAGIHPLAYGSLGRSGLLHGRSLDDGGLMTYYVLTFMRVASRRVCIAGITTSPDRRWMEQMARNMSLADVGFLNGCRYLLHDRDAKFCSAFAG